MARELSTRVRNAIRRLAPNAEFHLKNVGVNGCKMGCSGFVANPGNGVIVYLDTDVLEFGSNRYMFRFARSTGDFTGGRNCWAKSLDEMAAEIARMLGDEAAFANAFR